MTRCGYTCIISDIDTEQHIGEKMTNPTPRTRSVNIAMPLHSFEKLSKLACAAKRKPGPVALDLVEKQLEMEPSHEQSCIS